MNDPSTVNILKEKDSRAVRRFQEGDHSAFDELMARYEGKIYAFLHHMCGCADKARDVAQDSFFTAFRYLGRFRGESSFKTWLYRIASTSCFKSNRRRKAEPRHHLSLEDLAPGEKEMRNLAAATWRDSPVEELLTSELNEHIERSLAKLPAPYRAVFILRDMEGLSAEETGATLKLSVAAVKSRLHRARLFLRKELAGYYLQEGRGGKDSRAGKTVAR